MNQYQLCAFADEASPKLSEQIVAMRENHIGLLEMRGVNGTNVAKLTAAEAKDAARELTAAGIKVWSLGSPAGKSPITEDFAVEREQFLRLLETAQITGAKCIRLFSFYGTEGKPEYRDEVMERLSRFVDLAKGSDVILCHENEKGIYGDNDERCAEIHRALPGLKAVFDPANFVQCHVDTLRAWELLKPYTYYGHIKDAAEDGHVVPPGQGLGHLRDYLPDLLKHSTGVLTMEPHLTEFVGLNALEGGERPAVGGWNFENPRAAFDYAVRCLREILDD